MIEDFRKRFFISLAITIPILVLSPMIQSWIGYSISLPGSIGKYLLAALSTFIFFHGGWPFITGLKDELSKKQPGMMTLIAVAITVAWGYSVGTTFGLPGKTFFW
jgi:Cu2+-exporting ATPase